MSTHAAPWPPLGATLADGRATFRVWAPAARRVELDLELPGAARRLPLAPDAAGDGLWSLSLEGVAAGARYRYRIDGGEPLPDPCSRAQPEGVHGPSELVDPHDFTWTDRNWAGLSLDGLTLYELHVGTFSPEGTFDGVAARLGYLRELGVRAIELMPLADFPGERNWGYDGVALYAPSRAYGGPAGLRRLVDAAHAHGLGVVLDVVYNHVGPEGNYLRAFSPFYFTDRYQTPWGEAINYDGPGSRGVREFVLQNAEQWLRDYHVDGLRLDATHAIEDRSDPHILLELQERGRAAAGRRSVVLIAENETHDPRLVAPPAQGGYGLDAVWADDFHHAVHTALTHEHEGYYREFDGSVAAIARVVREGTLRRHGASTGLPLRRAVFCIQNHDQVGNRAFGERLSALVGPALCRVAAALLLFAPEPPLLFMGEEFAAGSPFLFFTEFAPDLGRLVTEGRRGEFSAFSAFNDEALRERIPDPQAPETFLRSKLDWAETASHAPMLRLYRDLLQLRRDDPVLTASEDPPETGALGDGALYLLRRAGGAVRLLLANLGEPITVAGGALPVEVATLRLMLSTADGRYRLAFETDETDEIAPAAGNVSSAAGAAAIPLPARAALLFAGG